MSTVTFTAKDANGVLLTEGMFVLHKTSGNMAVVHAIKNYGDIVLRFPGNALPLTTRGCYLEVL